MAKGKIDAVYETICLICGQPMEVLISDHPCTIDAYLSHPECVPDNRGGEWDIHDYDFGAPLF